MKRVLIKLTSLILVSLCIFTSSSHTTRRNVDTLNFNSPEFTRELIIGVQRREAPQSSQTSSTAMLANFEDPPSIKKLELAVYNETSVFDVDNVVLDLYYGLSPNYKPEFQYDKEGNYFRCDLIYIGLQVTYSGNKKYTRGIYRDVLMLDDGYIDDPKSYHFDLTNYNKSAYAEGPYSYESFKKSTQIIIPELYFRERVGAITLNLFAFPVLEGKRVMIDKDIKGYIDFSIDLCYIRQGNKVVLLEGGSATERKYE